MNKRVCPKLLPHHVLVVLFLLMIPGACGALLAAAENKGMSFPSIARTPAPAAVDLHTLKALPSQDFDSGKNFQVDLQSADLSGLDLRGRMTDLSCADFNSHTKWPSLIPGEFNPQRTMELGKNPGLGIRALHRRGITGKGVGVAIIDAWALLTEHQEYRDRLRYYEEMPPHQREARIHACAVTSAAVGKNVGVAPGADLYFIGIGPHPHNNPAYPKRVSDFTWCGRAVDRICEINRSLPKERRIRVIAIPMSWEGAVDEFNEMLVAAVNRAKEEGIFVISCNIEDTYREEKISFGPAFGLGRAPLADPDRTLSFGPCYYYERDFAQGSLTNLDGLLLPMDSRSMASATGARDYLFCRFGGSSWVVPYAAGLYALACQVRPGITPVAFWKTALDTGDRIEVECRGSRHPFGTIVNPGRLMEYLGR